MLPFMSSQPSSAQPFSDKVGKFAETSAIEQSIIEGQLEASCKIVIVDTRLQDELRTKGFGDKEDSDYVLKPYEALYLLYSKRLKVNNEPNITFRSLFERLLKYNKNIMTEFLVYRDLRSRGYVAKEGFGFGNDFRVYERGTYQKKPAKYVVFGIKEGANTTAKEFATAVDQIQKMGKEAVVAVIERRGEVIYYKTSKVRFVQNKYPAEAGGKG